MKTKKKIKLESLKIQSFVTSLDDDAKEKINGGIIIQSPLWLCNPDIPTAEECSITCPDDGC